MVLSRAEVLRPSFCMGTVNQSPFIGVNLKL
jgi:hypothetical protein